MKHIRRSRRAMALTVVAVLAIAGAAFAYWTTSGGGSGSATTGTDSGVSVTQVGSISGLVPGGDAKAVDFMITNPASTPQYITSVTYSIDSIKKADGSAAQGCDASDFQLVQPDAIGQDLQSGDTTFSPSGATIAMKNLSTNQDGCKNVTVNLAFQAA